MYPSGVPYQQSPPPYLRPKNNAKWLVVGIAIFVIAFTASVGMLVWFVATARPRVPSTTEVPSVTRDYKDGWKNYEIKCMQMSVDLPGAPKNSAGDPQKLPTGTRLLDAILAGYRVKTDYGHISLYYASYRDQERKRPVDSLVGVETRYAKESIAYKDVTDEETDITVDGIDATEVVMHYQYRDKPWVQRTIFIPTRGRTWTVRMYNHAPDDELANKDFDRLIKSWKFLTKPSS